MDIQGGGTLVIIKFKFGEEKDLKKQSNLSRLMGYAGRYKYLTYASWILSAVSSLAALVPFWYIWEIIREVLAVSPDFYQSKICRTTELWRFCLRFCHF